MASDDFGLELLTASETAPIDRLPTTHELVGARVLKYTGGGSVPWTSVAISSEFREAVTDDSALLLVALGIIDRAFAMATIHSGNQRFASLFAMISRELRRAVSPPGAPAHESLPGVLHASGTSTSAAARSALRSLVLADDVRQEEAERKEKKRLAAEAGELTDSAEQIGNASIVDTETGFANDDEHLPDSLSGKDISASDIWGESQRQARSTAIAASAAVCETASHDFASTLAMRTDSLPSAAAAPAVPASPPGRQTTGRPRPASTGRVRTAYGSMTIPLQYQSALKAASPRRGRGVGPVARWQFAATPGAALHGAETAGGIGGVHADRPGAVLRPTALAQTGPACSEDTGALRIGLDRDGETPRSSATASNSRLSDAGAADGTRPLLDLLSGPQELRPLVRKLVYAVRALVNAGADAAELEERISGVAAALVNPDLYPGDKAVEASAKAIPPGAGLSMGTFRADAQREAARKAALLSHTILIVKQIGSMQQRLNKTGAIVSFAAARWQSATKRQFFRLWRNSVSRRKAQLETVHALIGRASRAGTLRATMAAWQAFAAHAKAEKVRTEVHAKMRLAEAVHEQARSLGHQVTQTRRSSELQRRQQVAAQEDVRALKKQLQQARLAARDSPHAQLSLVEQGWMMMTAALVGRRLDASLRWLLLSFSGLPQFGAQVQRLNADPHELLAKILSVDRSISLSAAGIKEEARHRGYTAHGTSARGAAAVDAGGESPTPRGGGVSGADAEYIVPVVHPLSIFNAADDFDPWRRPAVVAGVSAAHDDQASIDSVAGRLDDQLLSADAAFAMQMPPDHRLRRMQGSLGRDGDALAGTAASPALPVLGSPGSAPGPLHAAPALGSARSGTATPRGAGTPGGALDGSARLRGHGAVDPLARLPRAPSEDANSRSGHGGGGALQAVSSTVATAGLTGVPTWTACATGPSTDPARRANPAEFGLASGALRPSLQPHMVAEHLGGITDVVNPMLLLTPAEADAVRCAAAARDLREAEIKGARARGKGAPLGGELYDDCALPPLPAEEDEALRVLTALPLDVLVLRWMNHHLLDGNRVGGLDEVDGAEVEDIRARLGASANARRLLRQQMAKARLLGRGGPLRTDTWSKGMFASLPRSESMVPGHDTGEEADAETLGDDRTPLVERMATLWSVGTSLYRMTGVKHEEEQAEAAAAAEQAGGAVEAEPSTATSGTRAGGGGNRRLSGVGRISQLRPVALRPALSEATLRMLHSELAQQAGEASRMDDEADEQSDCGGGRQVAEVGSPRGWSVSEAPSREQAQLAALAHNASSGGVAGSAAGSLAKQHTTHRVVTAETAAIATPGTASRRARRGRSSAAIAPGPGSRPTRPGAAADSAEGGVARSSAVELQAAAAAEARPAAAEGAAAVASAAAANAARDSGAPSEGGRPPPHGAASAPGGATPRRPASPRYRRKPLRAGDEEGEELGTDPSAAHSLQQLAMGAELRRTVLESFGEDAAEGSALALLCHRLTASSHRSRRRLVTALLAPASRLGGRENGRTLPVRPDLVWHALRAAEIPKPLFVAKAKEQAAQLAAEAEAALRAGKGPAKPDPAKRFVGARKRRGPRSAAAVARTVRAKAVLEAKQQLARSEDLADGLMRDAHFARVTGRSSGQQSSKDAAEERRQERRQRRAARKERQASAMRRGGVGHVSAQQHKSSLTDAQLDLRAASATVNASLNDAEVLSSTTTEASAASDEIEDLVSSGSEDENEQAAARFEHTIAWGGADGMFAAAVPGPLTDDEVCPEANDEQMHEAPAAASSAAQLLGPEEALSSPRSGGRPAPSSPRSFRRSGPSPRHGGLVPAAPPSTRPPSGPGRHPPSLQSVDETQTTEVASPAGAAATTVSAWDEGAGPAATMPGLPPLPTLRRGLSKASALQRAARACLAVVERSGEGELGPKLRNSTPLQRAEEAVVRLVRAGVPSGMITGEQLLSAAADPATGRLPESVAGADVAAYAPAAPWQGSGFLLASCAFLFCSSPELRAPMSFIRQAERATVLDAYQNHGRRHVSAYAHEAHQRRHVIRTSGGVLEVSAGAADSVAPAAGGSLSASPRAGAAAPPRSSRTAGRGRSRTRRGQGERSAGAGAAGPAGASATTEAPGAAGAGSARRRGRGVRGRAGSSETRGMGAVSGQRGASERVVDGGDSTSLGPAERHRAADVVDTLQGGHGGRNDSGAVVKEPVELQPHPILQVRIEPRTGSRSPSGAASPRAARGGFRLSDPVETADMVGRLKSVMSLGQDEMLAHPLTLARVIRAVVQVRDEWRTLVTMSSRPTTARHVNRAAVAAGVEAADVIDRVVATARAARHARWNMWIRLREHVQAASWTMLRRIAAGQRISIVDRKTLRMRKAFVSEPLGPTVMRGALRAAFRAQSCVRHSTTLARGYFRKAMASAGVKWPGQSSEAVARAGKGSQPGAGGGETKRRVAAYGASGNDEGDSEDEAEALVGDLTVPQLFSLLNVAARGRIGEMLKGFIAASPPVVSPSSASAAPASGALGTADEVIAPAALANTGELAGRLASGDVSAIDPASSSSLRRLAAAATLHRCSAIFGSASFRVLSPVGAAGLVSRGADSMPYAQAPRVEEAADRFAQTADLHAVTSRLQAVLTTHFDSLRAAFARYAASARAGSAAKMDATEFMELLEDARLLSQDEGDAEEWLSHELHGVEAATRNADGPGRKGGGAGMGSRSVLVTKDGKSVLLEAKAQAKPSHRSPLPTIGGGLTRAEARVAFLAACDADVASLAASVSFAATFARVAEPRAELHASQFVVALLHASILFCARERAALAMRAGSLASAAILRGGRAEAASVQTAYTKINHKLRSWGLMPAEAAASRRALAGDSFRLPGAAPDKRLQSRTGSRMGLSAESSVGSIGTATSDRTRGAESVSIPRSGQSGRRTRPLDPEGGHFPGRKGTVGLEELLQSSAVALTEGVWEATTDPAVALAVVVRFFVIRAAGQRPLTELAVAMRRPATRNVVSRHRRALQSIYAMFVADRRAAIAEALRRTRDENVERGTHTATQAAAIMDENELVRASMTVGDMWRLLRDDTAVIGAGNAADTALRGSGAARSLRPGEVHMEPLPTLSPAQFLWVVAKVKAAGIAVEDRDAGAAAMDEAAVVAVKALRGMPSFGGVAAAMLGDAAAAAAAGALQPSSVQGRPRAGRAGVDAGMAAIRTGSFRRSPSSLTLVSDAAASLSSPKAPVPSGTSPASAAAAPSSKVVAKTIAAARRVAVVIAQAVMAGGPHEDAAALVQARRLHGAPEWHTDAELEGIAEWSSMAPTGVARTGAGGEASVSGELHRSFSSRANRGKSGHRTGGKHDDGAPGSTAMRPDLLPTLPPTASATLIKLVLAKEARGALKSVTRKHLELTGRVREGLVVELKRTQHLLHPFPALAVTAADPLTAAPTFPTADASASFRRGSPARVLSDAATGTVRVGSGHGFAHAASGVAAPQVAGIVGTAVTATGHIVPPAALLIMQFAGCLGSPDNVGLGNGEASRAKPAASATGAPGPVPQPSETELVPAVAAAMSIDADTDISFAEFVLMLGAVASALSPDPYEDLALKLEAFVSERILPGFRVAVVL